VINEGAQRVKPVAPLEGRCSELLVAVRGDQGGVDIDNHRMLRVDIVLGSPLTHATDLACTRADAMAAKAFGAPAPSASMTLPDRAPRAVYANAPTQSTTPAWQKEFKQQSTRPPT
jgi:hypothetical protein